MPGVVPDIGSSVTSSGFLSRIVRYVVVDRLLQPDVAPGGLRQVPAVLQHFVEDLSVLEFGPMLIRDR